MWVILLPNDFWMFSVDFKSLKQSNGKMSCFHSMNGQTRLKLLAIIPIVDEFVEYCFMRKFCHYYKNSFIL